MNGEICDAADAHETVIQFVGPGGARIVARALAAKPKLLMLDEPAAGLNPTEREDIRGLVETVFARGVSILLVEHDVRLVTGLCSRVIALDHGVKIADGLPAAVVADPRVQEAYFGPEEGINADTAA